MWFRSWRSELGTDMKKIRTSIAALFWTGWWCKRPSLSPRTLLHQRPQPSGALWYLPDSMDFRDVVQPLKRRIGYRYGDTRLDKRISSSAFLNWMINVFPRLKTFSIWQFPCLCGSNMTYIFSQQNYEFKRKSRGMGGFSKRIKTNGVLWHYNTFALFLDYTLTKFLLILNFQAAFPCKIRAEVTFDIEISMKRMVVRHEM